MLVLGDSSSTESRTSKKSERRTREREASERESSLHCTVVPHAGGQADPDDPTGDRSVTGS